jgi:hypothetical protein
MRRVQSSKQTVGKVRKQQNKLKDMDLGDQYLEQLLVGAGLSKAKNDSDQEALKKLDPNAKPAFLERIEKMFDTIRDNTNIEASGENFDNMDINASPNDADGTKKEQVTIKTRLCQKYRKLRTCDYPPGQCPFAHNVSELGVTYKPNEWVGYFTGSQLVGRPLSSVKRQEITDLINEKYFRSNPRIHIIRDNPNSSKNKPFLERDIKANIKVGRIEDLKVIFKEFGEVVDIGMGPEFSWVEYVMEDSALRAIAAMNQQFINNVRVKVEPSPSPELNDVDMS